jgi:hypothetical protein
MLVPSIKNCPPFGKFASTHSMMIDTLSTTKQAESTFDREKHQVTKRGDRRSKEGYLQIHQNRQ